MSIFCQHNLHHDHNDILYIGKQRTIGRIISCLSGLNPVEPPCSWVPFSAVGCGNMESDWPPASFGTEAEDGGDPTLFLPGMISTRLRNKMGSETTKKF